MGETRTNVIPFVRPAFTNAQDAEVPTPNNRYPLYLNTVFHLALLIDNYAANFTARMRDVLQDLNLQYYLKGSVSSYTVSIPMPLDSPGLSDIVDSYIADMAENSPHRFLTFLRHNDPLLCKAYETDHNIRHVCNADGRNLYLQELLRGLQQKTVLDELVARTLPAFELSFSFRTDEKSGPVFMMKFNWDEACDARKELKQFMDDRHPHLTLAVR